MTAPDLTHDELVAHFVDHFDHHDPRLGNVSQDVYAVMREQCPIAHSDQHGGFWIVNGYEEAHEAYQRYDLFSASPSVNVPAGLGRARPMVPIEIDPPLHGTFRSLLAPVFAPARIAALEPMIRDTCNELIDTFIDDGHCDLIGQFGTPLPTQTFIHMMGLPIDEADDFHTLMKQIVHGHAKDDPEGTRRKAAGAELERRMAALYEQRVADPGDDIVSVLIGAEVDGERLTPVEVLDMTYLLMVAGLDTVAASIGLQYLYLAQHPEQRDRLVQDPSLIPNAVEELLRYESLILTGRTVTRDAEFHGVTLHAGDRLLINSVSAGRDEQQFEHADVVDFDRSPIRHLAFAAGPHRCVGSHLARLELRVVHEIVHERIPDYRLADGAQIHRYTGSSAGVDELPLVWS